jgi:predicted molibdopterin-dependent oxidoreductase YjgC
MRNANSKDDDDRLLRAKIPAEDTGISIRKTICSICNPVSHCGIDAYIKDGRVIKVEGTLENPHNMGTLCAKANLTEIVPPGVVSIAHGNPAADVNLLIEPDNLDPISGFPGFKSLLCEVAKADAKI